MNKKFSTLMATALVLAGSLWSGDAMAKQTKVSTLAELQSVTNWATVKGLDNSSTTDWILKTGLDTLCFANTEDVIKFETYLQKAGADTGSNGVGTVSHLVIADKVVILADKGSKGIEGHLCITADDVTVKGLTISNKTVNTQPTASKTGIELRKAVTRATIVDNVITEPEIAAGFMTYGIRVHGAAEKMVIKGNKITTKTFVKDSGESSYASTGIVFRGEKGGNLGAKIAAQNTLDCAMDFFDQRTVVIPEPVNQRTASQTKEVLYSAQVTYDENCPEAIVTMLADYSADTKSLVVKGAGALDVVSAINNSIDKTQAKLPANFALIVDGVNVVAGTAKALDTSLKTVVLDVTGGGSADATVDVDYEKSDAGLTKAYTADDLNKILGDGFMLTLTSSKGEAIDKGDVISEKLLTAIGTGGDDKIALTYDLKLGEKFLTVVAEQWENIPEAPYKVKFVDEKADATAFEILNVDGKLIVIAKVDASNVLLTVVSTDLGTVLTGVKSTTVKTSLTAKLSKTNMVNGKVDIKNNPLLNRYVTFTFATDDKNIAAKNGKVLGVDNKTGGSKDLVEVDRYLQSKPEGQWAVTLENDSEYKFKFTNREKSNIHFSASALYLIDANTNKYAAVVDYPTFSGGVRDTFIINGVDLTMTSKDYYVNYTKEEIKDTQYKMAIASTETTDFYVTENHAGKHLLGLTKEEANAVNWKLVATKDTVLLTNDYGVYSNGSYTDVSEAIKIPTYALQNAANNEYMTYAPKELALDEEAMYCDPKSVDLTKENDLSTYAFVLKKRADGLFNIIGIKKNGSNYVLDLSKKLFGATTEKNGQVQVEESWEQINSNDLFKLTAVDAPEYHSVEKDGFGKKVSIFREENNSQVLYEKIDTKSIVDNDTLSFLNIDNVYQFDKINPSMFVDTAYIKRGANTCWQYLLAVNAAVHNPDTCTIPGHPKTDRMVTGRYLINLIDTANVYGATHLHSNPYINRTEAGEYLAKLSFVDAMHINDTLIVNRKGGEAVKLYMNTPNFNVAKFAFRYVNPADKSNKTFKIQTQFKDYKNGDLTKADNESNDGYLKWINGTVVVVEGYANGDVFGINEDETRIPTDNETVATTEISVIAGNGSVSILNAAGKTVVISNILGQALVNTTITSDNATISVPAGIVAVVAVEGESAVKAIVR